MGVEAFDAIWDEHIGTPQPDFLKDVVAGTGGDNGQNPLTADEMEPILQNTVVVMTAMPEKREEWLQTVNGRMQGVPEGDDSAFLSAIVGLLKDEDATLSADNKHHAVWTAIQAGISDGGQSAPSTPPPQQVDISTEQLQEMVQNIAHILQHDTDQKPVLRGIVNHNRNIAVGIGDKTAAAFFDAVVSLIDADGVDSVPTPTLDGAFAVAWTALLKMLQSDVDGGSMGDE
ncbi:MAG: hypothetical protein EA396_12430 [Anaerolineaceae bacterium]|nr:MAG: hypothetical protein EA396_12430 [Anaerolineaceae bacterium]